MLSNDYLERVYSGLLAMNIGIRLGAPVEPTAWSSERIERFYGDITGYIKEFKNFAADDDANGPVFFLRALYDDAKGDTLTPQDVANAWLNYAREGIGMFWWGGYGVSTEHTAYLNLKAGIGAPQSGSIAVNGLTMAEQIGGQIFIDTWGLIFPNNPHKAAEFAMAAAKVSHDGNGVYGAAFIAAAIARAFSTVCVEEIIAAGLGEIPDDCTYSRVVNAVCSFHQENPEDWRKCLKFLQDNWGYDKYGGVCHIIPNAGICVMSMLYGKTMARSVEIATMAGWDTDCNAGNVGTIMGVAEGLEGIPSHYRSPINDGIVLSGISGYLNILDLPTYAKEVAALGYRMINEPLPANLKINSREINFDFELPGATHNFRLSGSNCCSIRHSTLRAHSGTGSLEILFDRLSRGQKCKIFYKPFYRRSDFDDERYMPVFSPTAYSGQTVQVWVYAERYSGESIILNPYVRNTTTKEDILLGGIVIRDEGWQQIEFVIPELSGAMIDEVGLLFEANSPAKNRDFGCLYIDDFSITGKACYTINIEKQSAEFASITPFSHNHGAWSLEDGYIQSSCLEHAEAMTGNYYTTDVVVEGEIIPHTGVSHLVSARVQGALHGYYAGLCSNGIGIFCNNHGMEQLAFAPYHWEYEQIYKIRLSAIGSCLSLSVNGEKLLEAIDDCHSYGMVGYAMYHMGRASFGNLKVQEL